MAARIAALGECMIELSSVKEGRTTLAYAGDSFNSAVYMARLGKEVGITVDYISAVGDDKQSDAIIDLATREGVGTTLIERLPGRLPGLYMIETDVTGERRFLYWRGQSAARDMLRGVRPLILAEALHGINLLYLTGISLSILDKNQQTALLKLLHNLRSKGTKIAFDSNFRPKAWPSHSEARILFTAIARLTDVALPTFEDEHALFGDQDPQATIVRLQESGVEEIVIKNGASGALIATKDEIEFSPTMPRQAVDTTAAGDAFNAGYIAARLAGHLPMAASTIGHTIAGTVIQYYGAIIPIEAMTSITISNRAHHNA